MKITLIHNPSSGDDNKPSRETLLSLMQQAGYTVTYQSSKDENWDKALDNPGEFVVVAGGDGTIGKVAKRLVGRQVPIAVLPLGTANNTSKTLGLTDQPLEELIAGWATASRLPFDVAIASGAWGSAYFLESLGFGLLSRAIVEASNSQAVKKAEDAKTEITKVWQMLQHQILHYPAQPLSVSLDGQDLSGQYILLEAMNIQYIGANLHLAPDAEPGDSYLDVVFLQEGEQDKLYQYIEKCLAGKSDRPEFTTHRGRHLQIQGKNTEFHVDDKLLSEEEPTSSSTATMSVEVKVNPHAIDFLISQ